MKVLRRFFSKRSKPQPISCGVCALEGLESRKLMSSLMTVSSVLADNRGEVTISLSSAADSTTVNKNSVQMYTTGKDGKFNTADDVRVVASVKYSPSLHRITIEGHTAAGTAYRVKLVGSRMKDANGVFLDGDFKGKFPSGNGVAGGNCEFQVKNDTSALPLVRLSTSLGVITIELAAKAKPQSVKNFLSYANSGAYDNIVITRSIPGFIVQLGSLQINNNNQLAEPTPGKPIPSEFNTNGAFSNVRGTVAFALAGSDQNSATNQFYFNLADNSSNLDVENGGFTVFAAVTNQSSLDVMDDIAKLQTVALRDLNGDGVAGPFNATDITNVPVNDITKYDGNGSDEPVGVDQNNTVITKFTVFGNFNPSTDLVTIRRTALLFKVAAL